MFRFRQKESVEYLEALQLKRYDFVVHAFCTRWGGVSAGKFANLNFSVQEGDTEENTVKNWSILSGSFDIPLHRFLTVNQVHGDDILVVESDAGDFHGHQGLEYDGIITNRPGLAVGVKTADCVPVFVVDRVKHIIGVVHAGWRGTSLGIAAKAINILVDRFSSRTEDIVAVIGPSIGPCCYEVDDVVFNSMKNDPERARVLRKGDTDNKWMFDLSSANRLHIIRAGVHPENVAVAEVCTSCRRETFFSHRGEGGNTGRQLSFIMMKEADA
jgi:YfiH family protein